MKCRHCGEELGTVGNEKDEYDLLKSHIKDCPSQKARTYRKAKEEERPSVFQI